MDWTSVTNRMKAIVEELEDEGTFEEEEENEEAEDGLSEEQVEALAALLGVEPDDLLQAEDEDIIGAMQYLGSKVVEAQEAYVSKYKDMSQTPYDHPHSPSTSGKKSPTAKVYPQRKGEPKEGYGSPTQPPTRAAMPGTASAKIPLKSHAKWGAGNRPKPIGNDYGRKKAKERGAR